MEKTFYDIFDEHIENIFKLAKKEPWKTRIENLSDKFIEGISEATNWEEDEVSELIIYSNTLQARLSEAIHEMFLDSYYDNLDDNIINAYINKFKHRLSRDAINCLDIIRKQNFSLFKVLERQKDDYIVIQDILLKTKPVKIESEFYSNTFKKGYYIYAKVIPFNNNYYLSDVNFIIDNDERFKNVKKFLNTNYKKCLPDLSEHYTVPDNKWIEVKKILDSNAFLLCLLGLVPIFEFEYFRLSYTEMKYKIKDKENVIKILDSLSKYQIIKESKHKWLQVEDRNNPQSNLLATIYIIKDELVCSAYTKNVLTDLNSLLQRKLKGYIGLAVFTEPEKELFEIE